MLKLRDYQSDLVERTEAALKKQQDPLLVLPTGGGKTVIFTELIRRHAGPALVVAPRKEPLAQASVALGRAGVYHRVIATDPTVRYVIQEHIARLGRSYVDPRAIHAVTGVDSYLRRSTAQDRDRYTMCVFDEGHHVLRDNKWGMIASAIPKARHMACTATPVRADGRGLGASSHGIFSHLIVGPPMRELIDRGFLAPYTAYCPPSSVNLKNVRRGADGDFVRTGIQTAIDHSTVTGDVVDYYVRYGLGRTGLVYTVSKKHAQEVCDRFNGAETPARVLSGTDAPKYRADTLRNLESGELKIIVSVDLLNEAVDIPSVSYCGLARPTCSYALYAQQIGRALRTYPGKRDAIIVDHVDNISRHDGPPDYPRTWSLDPRPRKKKKEAPPAVRICVSCTQPYTRILDVCPYCGDPPPPPSRSERTIEEVEGDLVAISYSSAQALLTAAYEARLPSSEYANTLFSKGCPALGVLRNTKIHRARALEQNAFRPHLRAWVHRARARGLTSTEMLRDFYHKFGMDLLTAQTLRGDLLSDLKKVIDGD